MPGINIVQILGPILPSFLLRQAHGPATTRHNEYRFAVLDGLRGWAALIVFSEHLCYNFTTTFSYGWGGYGIKTIVQLPFIRILWSGQAMVYIFFVTSGFVLSYRVLQHARDDRLDLAYDAIASMTLRRGFRLYVPTCCVVLLCAACVQLGVFEPARQVWNGGGFVLHEELPPYRDGFAAQMVDAVRHCSDLFLFWDWTVHKHAGNYDLHTWTIPVDFRTSMVLLLLLTCVCRLTRTAQVSVFIGVAFYGYWSSIPELSSFVLGALLAELELNRLKDSKIERPLHANRRSMLGLGLFLMGWYLCSIPFAFADTDPMYAFLIMSNPDPERFDAPDYARSIGAFLLVYGVLQCTQLRPFFNNPLSLYLGKISFSIYLIHGNVLKSVLYASVPTITRLTGNGTQWDQTYLGVILECAIGAVLTLPLTIWLADLFWRYIETPSLSYTKMLESVMVKSKVINDNVQTKAAKQHKHND